MDERFLSSEEYDERAHQLYNQGDYDGALAMLKEGLALYPNAVDLYVGLGYARLAREEFAWARLAFEQAIALDLTHEDALVGLGETVLRFGELERALALFRQVQDLGYGEDVELLLTMGRALYREGLFPDCREMFAKAAAAHPENAEAVASLGYALHRTGDEIGACRQIRRALRVAPDLYEARIYLGHLLYDRGDSGGALREFERVPPSEHWDSLAVWRLIELKQSHWELEREDPRLAPWTDRLQQLEDFTDPIDRLLAEVEAQHGGAGGWVLPDENQLELFERAHGSQGLEVHQVRMLDGLVFRGTWHEIMRHMRDHAGFSHETVGDFMRRLAERWHEQAGVELPALDPESFLRAAISAGIMKLEDE